jgi:cellulose synthase/poly-beta-1,6-N-acetylglucosamine synthase-like glycosyltransferase
MTVAPASWVWTAAFVATVLIFTAMAASTLWHQRWVRRLPALDTPPDPAWATPVHVSVVIAARDEAATITDTVRALLAQRGVALEVIVVSDRSTDGTVDAVRRLGAEDARARIVEVTALPERWLGKCHACHVGAATAAGTWILFTDADCRLTPDVLARALAAAAREQADHVALTPGPVNPTLGAKAWYLVFGASVANWISAANRDLKDGHFGIGAFNLVRAATYRASGGYEALRLTIVDDVRLSLLVRRAGGRHLLRAALRDAAGGSGVGHMAGCRVRPVALPAQHPGSGRRTTRRLVAGRRSAGALPLPAADVRDGAVDGPDAAPRRRALARHVLSARRPAGRRAEVAESRAALSRTR